MKQCLPYNVLMAVAVVIAGITLFYNLVLRESFSVFVKYDMPAIPQPEQAEIIAVNADRNDSDSGMEADAELAQPGEADDAGGLVSVTFPININEATEEQLRFIPGVGNVTSQRIVQYREALGGYTSLEQLMDIKGISEKAYGNISAYLVINEEE